MNIAKDMHPWRPLPESAYAKRQEQALTVLINSIEHKASGLSLSYPLYYANSTLNTQERLLLLLLARKSFVNRLDPLNLILLNITHSFIAVKNI